MSEKPEDVAKELEDTGSELDDAVLDDAVLEDVAGGLSDTDTNNNINGSC